MRHHNIVSEHEPSLTRPTVTLDGYEDEEPTRSSRNPEAEAGAKPCLTMAETAVLLGVSRWLVQQQVAEGKLPSIRLGRRVLIPRVRLLAWLEADPTLDPVGIPSPPDGWRSHAN